jgi:hypothetical protein
MCDDGEGMADEIEIDSVLKALLREKITVRFNWARLRRYGIDKHAFCDAVEQAIDRGFLQLYTDDGFARVTPELTDAGMARVAALAA